MDEEPCLPRIRDAALDDAAVIAEIYNESIATGASTMDDEPKTAGAILTQMRSFTDREGYVLLERGEEILGWGVIKLYSARPGYRFCAETSVYLRHRHVRRGWGSVLKRELIARCRAHGYHHLIARVFASNTASIEYNRAFGYEVVGIQREIGFKQGRWCDIAILQLVLEDGD